MYKCDRCSQDKELSEIAYMGSEYDQCNPCMQLNIVCIACKDIPSTKGVEVSNESET